MKDLSLIVDGLMWILVCGLAFYILCLIIYCAVYRKRLPCIEDEHRKLKPEDVEGVWLVSTPMDHENEFMKMYKEGRKTLPTLRECVKICEENPEICEMLAYFQKEKEKEKMKNNEMPELQFGDVVKYHDGSYWMVCRTRIYRLMDTDGVLCPAQVSRSLDDTENIVRVYVPNNHVHGFTQAQLKSIRDGHGEDFVRWKLSKVREMTMSQLREELGYPVKIIGEQ